MSDTIWPVESRVVPQLKTRARPHIIACFKTDSCCYMWVSSADYWISLETQREGLAF